MEKIQQEIARTDPEIPFRASTSHVHYTWAKTFSSRPELYIQPQSLPEIQKVVKLARRCRRRIVVVGCGHSPSDLTCTSSWMINLDRYNRVLNVDKQKKTMLVEGGIRLRQLNTEGDKVGLTIPNLGSIDEQSIVGAFATATHGSSLKHGLLSENVRSLRIVLSNGQAVRCSAEQNQELFRAALVSLGALGIITEVEYEMTDSCNIEWEQTLIPLDEVLSRWETDLWTQKEYTRVWWMPYMKRTIVWSAAKTDKPLRAADENFYGGSVGFHTYHNLLWLSNYVPWILPTIEWFVFGMQYGFKPGSKTSAVEPLRTGLLMNCLFSQFVNEWALPLSRGPEAIRRLSAWINGEPDSGIPFSVKGLYVHCPVEVRVSDTRNSGQPRPYLDNTSSTEPTLYLNATLYRPYLQDPPCKDRYYEAFEWLMREMGAKPHYAKNFSFTNWQHISAMFRDDLQKWKQMRNEADPEGMFLGEWHRRSLGLGNAEMEKQQHFSLQESEVARKSARPGTCQLWMGSMSDSDSSTTAGQGKLVETTAETEDKHVSSGPQSGSPTMSSTSGESFDMLHAAEAEKSTLFAAPAGGEDEADDTELMHQIEKRYHGNPKDSMITGNTLAFDKM